MKRHESIAPLSREHHANLILAQLLKSDIADYKGMPSSSEDKRTYAIELYNKEIKEHFLKEENVFAIISHHSQLKSLINEIIEEHKLLRNYFENLPQDETLTIKLNELGVTLEEHIRKEERVLFPLIQEVCSEEELNRVSEIL